MVSGIHTIPISFLDFYGNGMGNGSHYWGIIENPTEKREDTRRITNMKKNRIRRRICFNLLVVDVVFPCHFQRISL